MRSLQNFDDFCAIVTDSADAVETIINNPELKESFRNDSIFMFICKVIKSHKEELKIIVAALDGECTPEDAFEKYGTADIARMVRDIKADPLFGELKAAFPSAQKKQGASSSGTAQEATPA